MSVFEYLLRDKRDDREIKHHRDGGHRTVAPAETIERITPLRARMGITRVANVTGLDRIGLPVVMVCRPNARSIAVSQGKGGDLDAATASGLMEAAELFHAEHIENPLTLSSRRDMERRVALIDIGRLPHVGGRTFDRDRPILWIEGYDLIARSPRWVPFECVSANYTLPAPPQSDCLDRSTNGLASGNSLGEAVCHGICEAIERDATTLWSLGPAANRHGTGLDLDTVDDAVCGRILASLHAADIAVHVWEITSDIGVPSFFCALTDQREPERHVGIGAGTHPARAVALTRALTEAVQVRTTYISGTRDDIDAAEYTDAGRAEKRQAIERMAASTARARAFSQAPDLQAGAFQDDLAWLLTRLQDAGADQVVAVDLGKPDIGLSVVKILIPGLEPPDDHPAYQPGERALAAMEAA